MYRRVVLAVFCIVSLSGMLEAADIKSGPQPGTKDNPKLLPGSFEILSVTPEKNAGRFHCPVSDFGLNPAVLIFTRSEPDAGNKALAMLLKELEARILKHPEVQFNVCVVFLNDGGYREALENKSEDLPKAIEFKDQRQQKIKDFAKTVGIQQIALGIDSVAGPEQYDLNKDADWTVLICNRLEVKGNFAFAKELAEDVKPILAQVDDLLPKKK